MSHYKTIQALGTPHVVHQGLIDMLDDMELAVMLSHIMYWSDKTDNPLGVYRSNDEFYQLYRFKADKVLKLSNRLETLGLISKTHKRLEHRIYYLFNVDTFDKLYGEFLAQNGESEKPVTANPKNQDSPIRKIKNGESEKTGLATLENQESLYTKITSENTTKITSESESQNFADEPLAGIQTPHAQDFENLENQNTDNQNLSNQNFVSKSIVHWQAPSLDQLRSILLDNDFTGVFTQAAYDQVLPKFKAHFENLEISENKHLATEQIRIDRLVAWIKREKITQQPIAQNVLIATPAIDPSQTIPCNGLAKPPFPKMGQKQSWYFVNVSRLAGETLDETHNRIMRETDWANFDYSQVSKDIVTAWFDSQKARQVA